jgi:hypothetical protein
MAANCCPAGADGGQTLCDETLTGVSRCYGPEAHDECLPDGQPCRFGDECCTGFCIPDADGTLLCNGSCASLGATCTADSDCCDGLCQNDQCEPNITGCAPLGVTCEADEDCCSALCDPDRRTCVVQPSDS